MAKYRGEISKSSCMKQLQRGFKCQCGQGACVFLEFMKGSKAMAWVIKGDMDGPKIAVSVSGILRETWGVKA